MHVPAMCVFLWAWLMWISLGATVVSAATTATATATATSSATSGSAAASFAPEARTSQNSAPSADLWDSSLLLKPESAQSVVRTTAISAVGEGLYIAGSFAGGGFFAPFHDDQVHFTPLDPKSPGGFILYKASRNSTQFTWGRQITSESTDGTVHISDVAAYFAVPAVSAMEPSAIIAGTFTGSSFTLGTSGGKYITVTGERNHISLFVAQVSHSGDFIWAQSRPLVSSSLFNSKLFGVPDFESKVERGVDDSEDVNIKFGKEKHSTRLLELPVHVHVDAETNNVFVAGTFSGVLQWKLGEEYFAGISSRPKTVDTYLLKLDLSTGAIISGRQSLATLPKSNPKDDLPIIFQVTNVEVDVCAPQLSLLVSGVSFPVDLKTGRPFSTNQTAFLTSVQLKTLDELEKEGNKSKPLEAIRFLPLGHMVLQSDAFFIDSNRFFVGHSMKVGDDSSDCSYVVSGLVDSTSPIQGSVVKQSTQKQSGFVASLPDNLSSNSINWSVQFPSVPEHHPPFVLAPNQLKAKSVIIAGFDSKDFRLSLGTDGKPAQDSVLAVSLSSITGKIERKTTIAVKARESLRSDLQLVSSTDGSWSALSGSYKGAAEDAGSSCWFALVDVQALTTAHTVSNDSMNSISSQSSMSASKSPQTTLTNYATNSSLNELEKEFVQSKTKGASDDIRVGDDQLRDDPGFSLREFEDPQAVGVARGGSRIAESAKSSPTTQAASMSSLEASKNITSRGNLSITESLDAEKAATTKSKSRNSSDSSTRATGLEATKSQAKEGLSAVSADLASKAPTTSTAPAVLTPAVAKIAGSTSRESHDAKDSEKRKLDDELAAVSGYDFLLVGIVIVIVFGLIGVNVRRRRTRRPPHGHSPHSRFEDHPADEAGGKSFVETLYSFVSSSGSESLVEGPHRYLSGESWSHIGQEGRVRSKSPPPPYHQLGYGSTQSRQPASGRNILPPVRRRDNEQRLAVSPVTVGSRASIGASAAESTASEGWGDWGDEV